ncbi:MAG TPA: hypothetical protein PLR86_02985, partial [Planctomycetota bacterium]|nr:hypothetical protein [Planctomycetota bacterium]
EQLIEKKQVDITQQEQVITPEKITTTNEQEQLTQQKQLTDTKQITQQEQLIEKKQVDITQQEQVIAPEKITTTNEQEQLTQQKQLTDTKQITQQEQLIDTEKLADTKQITITNEKEKVITTEKVIEQEQLNKNEQINTINEKEKVIEQEQFAEQEQLTDIEEAIIPDKVTDTEKVATTTEQEQLITSEQAQPHLWLDGKEYFKENITAFAVSWQKDVVALGVESGKVILLDFESKNVICILQGKEHFHEESIQSLLFSWDGNVLISVDKNNYCIKWDLKKKQDVYCIHPKRNVEFWNVSSDGVWIFRGFSNFIEIYNSLDDSYRESDRLRRAGLSVTFYNDCVVSLSLEKNRLKESFKVYDFDFNKGKLSRNPIVKTDFIGQMILLTNSNILMAWHENSVFILDWETKEWNCIGSHSCNIEKLFIDKSENVIGLVDSENKVIFYHWKNWEWTHSLDISNMFPISSLFCLSNAFPLILLSHDGKIYVYRR